MKINWKLDRTIGSTRWLKMVERYYTNKDGEAASWTFVERVGDRRASVIVAKTIETKSYIITRQFRVPVGKYVYEFPAGLIDKDETPEEAALRELEEETGYRGKTIKRSGMLSSSAGLTSEQIYLVYIECDEEPKSKVRLEASEELEVIKLSPDQVKAFIENCHGAIVDAKMYAVLESSV